MLLGINIIRKLALCAPKSSVPCPEPGRTRRRTNPMAKFRKKPATIEAVQFRAGEQPHELANDVITGRVRYVEDGTMLIDTLEGSMIARSGDWIIRGVKGELYPCKPDIFAATYEPAGAETQEEKGR